MSPLVRARSWVAKKNNQRDASSSPSSFNSSPTAHSTRLARPSNLTTSQRPKTPASSPTIPHSVIATYANQRSSNPLGSNQSKATAVTAEQLQEVLHRHQLEMALVKQEARGLKEEKAFLMARNLLLERELCVNSRSASSAGFCNSAEQRRHADVGRRPSFSRSRGHLSADFNEQFSSSLSLHSPTHSGSSSSSHPWPCSSGGMSTPASISPSCHSRNPSAASLGGITGNHAPPAMSRRTSLSGGGGGVYPPEPASAHHRPCLHTRSQRSFHAPGLGLSSLRPTSLVSAPSDPWARSGSASNPSSGAPSRRNSLSGGGHGEPPLKGILKPTGPPVRPLSSCARISNEALPRSSRVGSAYYVEEGYDSITHASNAPRAMHKASFPLPSSQRNRRSSLDMASVEQDRLELRRRAAQV